METHHPRICMAAGCGRENPKGTAGETFRCCLYCRTKAQYKSPADRNDGPERKCRVGSCKRKYKDLRKRCQDCRTFEIARTQAHRENKQELYEALVEQYILQNTNDSTKARTALERMWHKPLTIAEKLAEVQKWNQLYKREPSREFAQLKHELLQVSRKRERHERERDDAAALTDLLRTEEREIEERLSALGCQSSHGNTRSRHGGARSRHGGARLSNWKGKERDAGDSGEEVIRTEDETDELQYDRGDFEVRGCGFGSRIFTKLLARTPSMDRTKQRGRARPLPASPVRSAGTPPMDIQAGPA